MEYQVGTGTITGSNSAAIPVGTLTNYSVVVTIDGTSSAFGGNCETGLNGCYYLNVNKGSGSFTVELRNPTDGSSVTASSPIAFSYIAIKNT